jgi:hypothetical protein
MESRQPLTARGVHPFTKEGVDVDIASVPGVATVHPRSSWVDPRYPVTGPATNWGRVDTAVIHYTAADNLIDGDPGEHASNLPAYIRSINKAYWTDPKRGYAIGYWWAVDWLGGVWQLRGWDIKSAANATHNEHTAPILVLVDGNDGATPKAAASIRALVAETERIAGRTVAITGHGQLTGAATQCPGAGLRFQIAVGHFTPRPDPIPEPPKDDDMKPIVTTWEGEPWPILISYDARSAHYVWCGFPGTSVEDAVAVGAVTDGRSTPWPAAWKDATFVLRVG